MTQKKGGEGKEPIKGWCNTPRLLNPARWWAHSFPRVRASMPVGQWPCPFPPIYKSEILHPIPPSSINSSQMYIQFKIPLLVFNPPWTCSRLLHILSLSLTSSNHLPLLFSQKLVPFLSNLLNSLLISLCPDNSLFITISQLPILQISFHTKAFQW